METETASVEQRIIIDVEAARRNSRGGVEGRIPCPACHHEHGYQKRNNRDMSVNLRTGAYFCHRCRTKGYVKGEEHGFVIQDRPLLKFIRREEVEFEFPPLPELPWDSSKTAEENWAARHDASVSQAISPEVAEWAKFRGLRPSSLYLFGVRCEGHKLHAPTRRAGNIVNVETRDTLTKRFHNVAGAQMLMYNLDEMLRPLHDDAPEGEGCLAYDTMIIVEGRADVWAAAEAGYYNVVSVPNGAASSVEPYINEDMDVMKVLRGLSKVIIAVDSDEEGRQLRQNLIEAIGAEKCWTVEYPEGCKDLGDVLRLHGTREIVKALCNALPVSNDILRQSDKGIGSSTSYFVEGVGNSTWPTLNRGKVLYGLAGEVVRTIEPHTEADNAALLLQFLTAFGNVVGRTAPFVTDGALQYPNLFTVIAGGTSAGKGTAWAHVNNIFKAVEPEWASERVQSGLSSGEGLIKAVSNEDRYSNDKRLMAVETEFSTVLSMNKREGNTLSAIVRGMWDEGRASTLTKNNPLTATDAHVSIIGHITPEELKTRLGNTELYNGFANRFLWVCVKRSKSLPRGGKVPASETAELSGRLKDIVSFSRQQVVEMVRDEEAEALWESVYDKLTEERLGAFGKATTRARPQVVRLSCIYALLDMSQMVRREHLEAALAVWQFCEDSARYLFGDSTGNVKADKLLNALRNASASGLSRTEMTQYVFKNNVSARELTDALSVLQRLKFAHLKVEGSGKTETERWYASNVVSGAKYEVDELNEADKLRTAA